MTSHLHLPSPALTVSSTASTITNHPTRDDFPDWRCEDGKQARIEALRIRMADGQGLNSRKVKTLIDVVPFGWRCCECGRRDWLVNPGYDAMVEIELEKIPITDDTAQSYESRNELCSGCNHRHCVFCELLNTDDELIATAGGLNLKADRLKPAGWQCCICSAQHYSMARYRPDLYVFMESMRNTGSQMAGPDNSAVDQSNKCFLPYKCAHVGKRPFHNPAQVTTPFGCSVITHEVCSYCHILNRYGESIGRVNVDTVILENTRGPLRDNLVWFHVKRQWIQRKLAAELESGVGINSIKKHKQAMILGVPEEISEAERIVEEVKEWIGELRRGIEGVKQRAGVMIGARAVEKHSCPRRTKMGRCECDGEVAGLQVPVGCTGEL